MGALGRFLLFFRATPQRVANRDPLDHQDLLILVDLALGLRGEPALARIDPARLQRATQRAGQSTGGGGHHVVERGRVLGVLAWRRAVVLADLVVGAEDHRVRFRRQESLPDRSALTDDPHLRNVDRAVLTHQTSLHTSIHSLTAKFPLASVSDSRRWRPTIAASSIYVAATWPCQLESGHSNGSSTISPGSFADSSRASARLTISLCRSGRPGGPAWFPSGKFRKAERGGRTRWVTSSADERVTVDMPSRSKTRATSPTDWWQAGQSGTSKAA